MRTSSPFPNFFRNSEVTLPLDSYTKLLLHMNGVDGSTTFTDESGKTITTHGGVEIDVIDGRACGLFDGNNDYLSFADSSDWDMGTGDFTIEFSMRFNTLKDCVLFEIGSEGSFYGFQYTDTLKICQLNTNYGVVELGNFSPYINSWYVVKIVRSGNTLSLYINSNLIGSSDVTGTSIDANAGGEIGTDGVSSVFFDGWIDEFRVSKGIAR